MITIISLLLAVAAATPVPTGALNFTPIAPTFVAKVVKCKRSAGLTVFGDEVKGLQQVHTTHGAIDDPTAPPAFVTAYKACMGQ